MFLWLLLFIWNLIIVLSGELYWHFCIYPCAWMKQWMHTQTHTRLPFAHHIESTFMRSKNHLVYKHFYFIYSILSTWMEWLLHSYCTSMYYGILAMSNLMERQPNTQTYMHPQEHKNSSPGKIRNFRVGTDAPIKDNWMERAYLARELTKTGRERKCWNFSNGRNGCAAV